VELTEEKDRTSINSRWTIIYGVGIGDDDTSTSLTYGDLYIPVKVIGQPEE